MSDIVIYRRFESTMKHLVLWFVVGCMPACVLAQQLSQNVRGRITDKITGAPLPGANIAIQGGEQPVGATSAEGGIYSVQVPLGRYKVLVTYTGYEAFQGELLVIAGKEAVLNISLLPASTVLEEVQVHATPELDVPGLQSLSIEKTLRIPANFFDPVRVATTYPAVVAANDQSNAIIIKGNSPNGLLWRLNGADIVNPNHLSNAGTFSDRPAVNGGGVNVISAQMLNKTDFYTSAIPVQYSNVLSGVIDMNLREGNKEKYEYTAQASVIGLDLAAEGPLGKAKNNSFLVNYRYSTVGLLSAMGVNFGDEDIRFQDLSFNLDMDQKNGSSVSLFGFWGNSKNEFGAKKENDWEEDKDKYDILYDAQSYAMGMNYTTPVASGKLSLALVYSSSEQERDAQISTQAPAWDRYLLWDRYTSRQGLLSTNLKYGVKAGGKNFWELGAMVNAQDNDTDIDRAVGCLMCSAITQTLLNGNVDGVLIQPYTNFTMSISPEAELSTGIRYVNFSYNGADAIEPRVNFLYTLSAASRFNVSYSLVSQQQLAQVYLADGNSTLKLTKSHHFDLGFRHNFTSDISLNSNFFYQHLFDVPIEQNPNSTFSTLNLIEGYAPEYLVNKGTGENYGVDITVERSFVNNSYLVVGGSYYESLYRGADGEQRDTRFNGNYTLNAVYGREWIKQSRSRTIGLSGRALYLGGMRESTVNVPASDAAGETIYDNDNPFNNQLEDYVRVDLRLSFRKNKPGYTRTLAIDIQNVLGQKNDAYNYYDRTQMKVVTKYQLGMIPVIVYRIDF